MRRYGLYLAWLISCLAILGSLYYSEILLLEACHLCWYQRICIYPLALILGIASFRGFIGIVPYVLPQVVIGGLIAAYQVAIQEIPGWEPIRLCGAGPSCTEKMAIGLGPITIPMLSVFAFVLIFSLLILTWTVDTWCRWRGK